MQQAQIDLMNLKDIYRWRNSPADWFREVLGFNTIWKKQIEIAESVRDHQKTAVRSGHSVGKTAIAARIGMWYLYCFYPSVVVTTAPTWRQVERFLWGEVHKAYNGAKIPLGGELFSTELRLDKKGKEWYMFGVSTDDPDKFVGEHELYILFIVDEAPGVPAEIFEAMEGSLGSPYAKVLLIGNPTDSSGFFGRVFFDPSEATDWNHIHINCWDSPNVIAGKNIIPQLCSYDWPAKMKKKWGENDNRYRVRVLGEFPIEAKNVLVSYANTQYALQNRLPQSEYLSEPAILAVDVARFGDDQTILLRRQGGYVRILHKVAENTVPEVIGQVLRILKADPIIKQVNVDVIGIGGGVVDGLEEEQNHGSPETRKLLQRVSIVAVNGAYSAPNDIDFDNLRAELAWRVKQAFEDRVLDIVDEDIALQANSIKYSYTKKGRYLIESKDSYKKRFKKSPDEFDALMLSYADISEDEKKPGLWIW